MRMSSMNPFALRPRRGQRGITLLETMIATAIASAALLFHAAGTLAGHRLTKAEETRSVALQSVREFVERMRADDDWGSIYSRFHSKATQAAYLGSQSDPRFFAPTDYYGDFATPEGLGTVTVLVQVPATDNVLREDAQDARYGLPYDLNGDGVVDSSAHDADYIVLPVVVRFRWTPPGEAAQEIEVPTWMGGNE
jgi:type II secretory pathway pseudopilin PulG